MAYIYGIDVSHHQGYIDFQEVKNSGIKFILMKVSQKAYADPKFEQYYKGAKSAGIPIGVYIYNKVKTEAEAKDEANFALKCLKDKGFEFVFISDLIYTDNYEIDHTGKQCKKAN